MTGEPDHPHVVAEVLAAELGADPQSPRHLVDRALELAVPEAPPVLVAGRRQGVEVAGRGELGDLQRVLGRGAADHHREVIGRARRGADRPELLLQERGQALRVQEGLRLLEEEALVGRAAALGDEQEPVLVARHGVDLDLRRQVRAGVDLPVHVEGRELRVPQVAGAVGVEHAAGDGRLVAAAGEDALPLLPHHDRRAGVLAGGQHAAGGHARVLEELEGHEPVVGRGLRVPEDVRQLLEVAGPEEVRDVAHRLVGQPGEGRRLDLEERPPGRRDRGHAVRGQQAIGRAVLTERQEVLVDELGHRAPPGARVSGQGSGLSLSIVDPGGARRPGRPPAPVACPGRPW